MNTKKPGRVIGHWNEYTPSQPMLAALRNAANPAGLDPWNFGSSTIGALKRCGLIVVHNRRAKPRRYELTDSGRSVLAEFGATTMAVITRTVCHSGVTLAPGDQVEVSVHAYAQYHTVYRVRRTQGHVWEEFNPGFTISCSFYSVEVDRSGAP